LLADRCNWTIPAWEWERLDLDDEEAGLWIERLVTIGVLRQRKVGMDQAQMEIDRAMRTNG